MKQSQSTSIVRANETLHCKILSLCHADWEPSSVVGWEANSNGKLAPRQVDLGPSMDPRRLAESAVTLNVSLMRWRAAPSLGIDRLQDLKILLLGAGGPHAVLFDTFATV